METRLEPEDLGETLDEIAKQDELVNGETLVAPKPDETMPLDFDDEDDLGAPKPDETLLENQVPLE